ncbi:hypothetical protein BN10_300006 [Phycicoccus elongatus Lp2]|uniref:Bacterial bifunctional deaminase-reductase C-terminal domain-containing protein n=1 Tax=Phycicoccus elongatus Lp2 TaxID=1193181 RepID=N0E1S0_9MICO|nr:hypothetical protein BN10_300006 [Phycicoccus elongatus Lp2]
MRRVGGVFGRADDLPPAELLANGTSFHVVDGTPEEVRALAREAAGGKDVRIGGGPTTVREFLSLDWPTSCRSCSCRSSRVEGCRCGRDSQASKTVTTSSRSRRRPRA